MVVCDWVRWNVIGRSFICLFSYTYHFPPFPLKQDDFLLLVNLGGLISARSLPSTLAALASAPPLLRSPSSTRFARELGTR